MSARIHVGMGGWVFEPWRGVFYPEGLTQKRELEFASRRVTAIEINSTYYSTQKPSTFARWASETPEGFVFTLKGSRFVTNRRELATAGESIKRYVEQGISQLGSRLGPIFWQFANTKKFDAADFEAFLELLPKQVDGAALRHAVEVRHDSFRTPEFVALLRKHETPVIYADHATYPAIPDITGDFVYARLSLGLGVRVDQLQVGRRGRRGHRLSARCARRLGREAQVLGRGGRAGRPGAGRHARPARAKAARGVRLHHPRGQGARARRRGGDHRPPGPGACAPRLTPLSLD